MNAQPIEQPPPALFLHCCTVYGTMLAEASEALADGEHSTIVYEGFLSTLITGKCNLSVPYYTSVTKALQRMGCIRQLRRGGGSAKSQWELITEPTLDLYESQLEVKDRKPTRLDVANDQIKELATRVADLEEWQESINKFLIKKFGVTDE